MKRTTALGPRVLLPVLLALAAWSTAACGGDPPDGGGAESSTEREGLPVVAVAHHPLRWIVQRLAGAAVEVVLPLPAGADPHHWRPTREALQRFQAADLIVLNGAGLESWAGSASLPPSRVLDASATLGEHLLAQPGVTHSHGGGGAHSHAETDGSVWMAPGLLALQAEAVADALLARGWVDEVRLREELRRLRDGLESLQRRIEGELRPAVQGVRLLAEEDRFDYLFDLPGGPTSVRSLHLDPDPADVSEIVGRVERGLAALDLESDAEAAPGLVLWSSEPTPALASALAETLGLGSVVVATGANPSSADVDLLELFGANLERLLAALQALRR